MELTKREYITFLKAENLSKDELKLLLLLYRTGNSSITALELSRQISPKSKGHIVASGAVGRIGKKMFKFFDNIEEKDLIHYDKNKPGFFSLIGYYDSLRGWAMHENLVKAMDSIILDLLVKQFAIKKY